MKVYIQSAQFPPIDLLNKAVKRMKDYLKVGSIIITNNDRVVYVVKIEDVSIKKIEWILLGEGLRPSPKTPPS